MIEAIGLIEGNDLLDVRTNLALARMRSWGGTETDNFAKVSAQKQQELAEQTKGKSIDEIRRLNDQFVNERQEVAMTDEAPEWDFPELKVSQFEAQQKIVRAGGRVYEKGESLVPTKFFVLMDDLIVE